MKQVEFYLFREKIIGFLSGEWPGILSPLLKDSVLHHFYFLYIKKVCTEKEPLIPIDAWHTQLNFAVWILHIQRVGSWK